MERLELGPAWRNTGFVLTEQDGTPLDPGKVTKAFAEGLKPAGPNAVRAHGLRHTYASLMLKTGVNPKVVSEPLGQASVGITLDIYSHVLLGLKEEAALPFSWLPLLESQAMVEATQRAVSRNFR
jgi:integrase